MRSIQLQVYLVSAILLIPLVFKAQGAGNNNVNTKKKESYMQSNKEIVQALYEQSMNKRNTALLPQLIGEDFTGPQGEKGVAGFESIIGPLINAFPDIQWKLEDIIQEGDKVAVSWQWTGTNTGAFRNFPASGKIVTSGGMGFYNCKNGKIISAQIQTDRLGFWQGIGVLPLDLTQVYIKK